MVFSLDLQSFIANRQVRTKMIEDRLFVSAGFTSDDHLATSAQFGEFAALGEYVPTRLIRKAVSTAAAITQGRDVQRRIEIPINFHDSPEDTGAGKLRAQSKNLKKRSLTK